METTTYYIKTVYDVIAMAMSLGIIYFSMVGFHYGAKYRHCRKHGYCIEGIRNKRFDWVIAINCIVNIVWAILFSYVFITTLFNSPPLRHDEFGAIFIRPTILITQALNAIFLEIKYRTCCDIKKKEEKNDGSD